METEKDCSTKLQEIRDKLMYIKGGIEALYDIPNRTLEDKAAGNIVLKLSNELLKIIEE